MVPSVKLLPVILIVAIGNFSLAAETLGITQPSLSRHIQALEAEIKQRLVCRSPHSFQLTDAGKSFLKYGTSWLQARHVLNIALDNLQAPAENILRIGLLSGIEQTELMEKMIDFQQAHPSLCLDLRTKPSSVLIPGLYAGSYDTVLLWHLNDRLENFCTLPYRTDRMILLIPEGHSLYGRESVMLSELKQETLYMRYRRSSHFFMRFIEHCQKNGFEPPIVSDEWYVSLRHSIWIVSVYALPASYDTMGLSLFHCRDYAAFSAYNFYKLERCFPRTSSRTAAC